MEDFFGNDTVHEKFVIEQAAIFSAFENRKIREYIKTTAARVRDELEQRTKQAQTSMARGGTSIPGSEE